MVVIRLARRGAKNRPFYHVVATDSRKPRDGRFIEKLGFYDPINKGKPNSLLIDVNKINYWVENGAQISNTVSKLVKIFSSK